MGIKYNVNSDFFKDWSPVMAYCLGFIYADGSLHRSARGHYLTITSTDEAIILNFKQWLARPGLFFLRKYTVFFNYFSLRPQRIDKEAQGRLRYSSDGHVAK
jgi:hypothetical protein